MHYLENLIQYRDLLWLWSVREIRVRYKQSMLGIVWAILQPLVLTLVFTIVFSWIVRIDTGDIPYPIFAYTAMVPWTFLATSISFGIPSLIGNMNLVTKVYFPREILPLASISAAFLDFLVASAILGLMFLYYDLLPGGLVLWVVPLLGIQIVLTIGVTLLGAAAIVFLRDVRFVIPLFTQIWFYATPVIYPVELVPEQLQPIYFLNPMAGVIDGYRRVLLMGLEPRFYPLAVGAIVSILFIVFGYYGFKRVEPYFSDLI